MSDPVKTQDVPPREFQPVKSPEEAKRLLADGVKLLASAMVWTKGQSDFIKTHLTVLNEEDKLLYAWVPPDFDPKKWREILAVSGSEQCYFSVSLPHVNIFFKCAYIGRDDAGIKFSLPGQIFKVQRRADFRFTIPEGHVLRGEIEDPLQAGKRLRYRAMDLSAGGMALELPAADQALFPLGTAIKALHFTLRGKNLAVEAVVRHSAAIPPDGRFKGVKLGLQFQNLKATESQLLIAYVLEQSRAHYLKFM